MGSGEEEQGDEEEEDGRHLGMGNTVSRRETVITSLTRGRGHAGASASKYNAKSGAR